MDEYPQNDSTTTENKNLERKWNKNGVKQH